MERDWLDDLARSSVVETASRRNILGRLTAGAIGAGLGALVGGAGRASAAAPVKCPPGLTLCGSVCRVTSIDPDNCGTCGNACGADQICRGGVCVFFCSGGEVLCGNTCANLQTDPENCGTCGNACPAGQTCSNGVCGANGTRCVLASDCASGFCVGGVCCDSACTGGCGTCVTGTCSPAPASTLCRPSAGECGVAEFCDGSSLDCPPDVDAPEGTPCAPPGPCYQSGVCDGFGVCVGVPRDCSDGNECTFDLCDGSSGACANPPVPDGTACTGGTCQGGVCVPG